MGDDMRDGEPPDMKEFTCKLLQDPAGSIGCIVLQSRPAKQQSNAAMQLTEM